MNKTNSDKKKKSNILLVIAIILLLCGVALLLVDPIKNYKRNKKVQEGLTIIEEQINTTEESVEMTFVVPVNGNEVEGEDYDYFSNDESVIEEQRENIQAELDSLGDQVTLNGIGILEIEKIDLRVPIWDEASIISLRYGVGHFESSVLPGENGNCSILGHHMRAYGSIFNRLSEVGVGDLIRVHTVGGVTYIYEVDNVLVVSPDNLEEYLQGDICEDSKITLVTCTYTSTETLRLLVVGHLVE